MRCSRALFAGAALIAASTVTLAACDGCAFVTCDGIGFGVWVTNDSDEELLIQFEPAERGESLFTVPPGVVDGAGPWVEVSTDPDGRPTAGAVTLLSAGCEVIDHFLAAPGEYRLRIGPDGNVSLTPEDVPNDLESVPLATAPKEC